MQVMELMQVTKGSSTNATTPAMRLRRVMRKRVRVARFLAATRRRWFEHEPV